MSLPKDTTATQGQKRKREFVDAEGNIRKKKHAPHSKKHKNRPRPGQDGEQGAQKSTTPSGPLPVARTQPGPSRPGQQNAPPANHRAALQQVRQQLPIYPHAASIRDSLTKTDILLLAGETGSGKSTQVPQFLLSAKWCTGRIGVTQPRRMAAISLARRVADELGTPLGKKSPAAQVGYSVRFDDNTGKSNRIKFLTDGMLLQEMLRDPGLKEYSCVIVDEVHERSINVDLILGFLRDLLTGKGKGAKRRMGKPLKVVIMSATADTATLKKFFEEGYQEAGLLENKTNGDAEDGEKTGSGKNMDKPSKAVAQIGGKEENVGTNGASTGHVTTCFVEGRQYPVQTIYLPDPTQDVLEAGLKCIFQVHCKEPMPGDILVFLTGQDAIQSLQKLVEEYAESLTADYPKLLVLPLYAALTQAAQQRIFSPAPPNTRKLILATNIAETSVTVPGVRFVIDSGKVKIDQYRVRLGLASLLVKPISRSSATQRKGRAGREAAGKCWRLYTEPDFEGLDKDTPPEILRVDLSHALLTMKARGVENPMDFPLLTRPPREAMERALLQLFQLGALNDDGRISDDGRKMARLPLAPSLGRVILAAASEEMDCLLQVIDIVACFDVEENIFLHTETEEQREEAQAARQLLFRRQGDHLTFLAVVQAYVAENTDRKQWCERHLVNHRAMQSVMDVRKQLRAQCQQASLLSASAIKDADEPTSAYASSTSEEAGTNILRCFLRGFITNVAASQPDGSYKTIIGHQNVAIHPSSVMFGRKVEAILYNKFEFTNRTYARGVSAVQLNWWDELHGGG